MRKIHAVIALSAIILSQQVMADVTTTTVMADNPCKTIAQACLSAGFTRDEIQGKKMWEDCMKPILLGQTVASVTVDTTLVQACQVNKVQELKQELDDLQKAISSQITTSTTSTTSTTVGQ